MSGLFEHLAAFDDDARIAARQAVAVAHKRVTDQLDSFLKGAVDRTDLNARISLVDDDVREIIASVVDEYGGDADNLYQSITSGWEDLVRGPDGRWGNPGATAVEEPKADDDINIDSELTDAPSAVGEGTLSKARTAESWDGGGAVKTEKLPKANDDGLSKHPSGPEFDHGFGHPKAPDGEISGTPNPTETQDVTEGRGDAQKGTSDYASDYGDPPKQKAPLKSEKLPTGDGWAGFAEGGEVGDHTDTWTEQEVDPVTSEVFAAIDPDRNPIADNLAAWQEEQGVQQAIAAFESASEGSDSDSDGDSDDEGECECAGPWESCKHCKKKDKKEAMGPGEEDRFINQRADDRYHREHGYDQGPDPAMVEQHEQGCPCDENSVWPECSEHGHLAPPGSPPGAPVPIAADPEPPVPPYPAEWPA